MLWHSKKNFIYPFKAFRPHHFGRSEIICKLNFNLGNLWLWVGLLDIPITSFIADFTIYFNATNKIKIYSHAAQLQRR